MLPKVQNVKGSNLHRLSLTVAVAALCSFSTSAIAQTAESESAKDKPVKDEMVVTARRREENLQDTPLSITAYSGEDLAKQSVQDFGDLQYQTPNLTIYAQADSTTAGRVTIRGMTVGETLITSDPAVGVYIDDVYYGRTQGNLTNLFDIERVEVLKGPQGTLYGRNTTGGAIKIISKKPTYEFGGFGNVIVGNYNRFDFSGGVNIPVVEDKFALRATYQDTKRDGFGYNPTLDQDLNDDNTRSFRVSALLEPTERSSLTVVYDNTKQRESGFLTKPLAFGAPASFLLLFAGLDADDLIDTPFYEMNSEVDSFSNLDLWGLSATGNVDFDGFSVKAVVSKREMERESNFDLDGTALPILNPRFPTNQEQFTAELQFSGEAMDDKLSWIAGLYHFDEEGEDGSETIALGALNPNNPNDTSGSLGTNSSDAIFASLNYAVSDQVEISGGLRYTDERKELVATAVAGPMSVCSLTLDPNATPDFDYSFDAAACKASFGEDYSFLSWDGGVKYTPTDDLMVYARVSRGYRSGGFVLRGTNLEQFTPFNEEQATAYEVGLKADMMDGMVRTNLAAFYTSYNEIQRASLVGLPNGGVGTTITNAAKAHISGFEADVTLNPTPELQIRGALGYTNAKYDDYVSSTGADLSANNFPLSPEFTYNISARYETPVTNNANLSLQADWAWQSKTNFRVINSPIVDQSEGYGLMNARVGVEFPERNIEVALFGKNLFEKEYTVNGLDFTTNLGHSVVQPGVPRFWGVELNYKFGAE